MVSSLEVKIGRSLSGSPEAVNHFIRFPLEPHFTAKVTKSAQKTRLYPKGCPGLFKWPGRFKPFLFLIFVRAS
jgi:hypothetical protein